MGVMGVMGVIGVIGKEIEVRLGRLGSLGSLGTNLKPLEIKGIFESYGNYGRLEIVSTIPINKSSLQFDIADYF